ncbi:MAG TPA: flavodoxin family protein [Candidatus Margulisiibacteriota bacterium]|nr:flavodoxin family protein [Candidatus Margulisiibacteriota bacterium]
MKVLLISSSPHKEKSSTFLLANEVLRGLKIEGVFCESLHLDDFKISFCKHCEACHRNILNCSLKDDTKMILYKMLDADGIIFASPNYINQVTASMKALFDRSAHFIHCKRLLGKYVAGVVTSGSGQNKEVLDYIGFYAHTCGAQYSGGVSALRQFGEDKKDEAVRLGRKMATDIKEVKMYADQAEAIEKSKNYFSRVIKLRKEDWQEEYKYWEEKGWV